NRSFREQAIGIVELHGLIVDRDRDDQRCLRLDGLPCRRLALRRKPVSFPSPMRHVRPRPIKCRFVVRPKIGGVGLSRVADTCRCQHCRTSACRRENGEPRAMACFGPGWLLPSGRSRTLILTHARYLESGPSTFGVAGGKRITPGEGSLPVEL